jgi:uncharacterized protein YndB with AHSA1/START domain
MTSQRDFKRVVRARMQKTGESYTAARVQVLRRKARDRGTGGQGDGKGLAAPAVDPADTAPMPATAGAPAKTRAADYARLAGMSDEAIKKNTGCDWKAWVGALDYVKAHDWPHRAIAQFVHERYGVRAWWTQAVTVGYERIRGLRDIGQRRDGSYEASRSRTFPVAPGTLFRAWAEKQRRTAWLGDAQLTVRTATRNRSMRITWGDGTSVQLWFTARAPRKSAVAVQHTRLPDRQAVNRLKEYWAGKLDALAAYLGCAD